jgi:hypothetical protein
MGDDQLLSKRKGSLGRLTRRMPLPNTVRDGSNVCAIAEMKTQAELVMRLIHEAMQQSQVRCHQIN